MEQELLHDPHPDYLKGFNEGYLIQQHMPQLAAIISRSLQSVNSERAAGIKAGSAQFQQEREKILTLTWMQPGINTHDDITPEQDKDDISIEPE